MSALLLLAGVIREVDQLLHRHDLEAKKDSGND
jgi:hypothetical protein